MLVRVGFVVDEVGDVFLPAPLFHWLYFVKGRTQPHTSYLKRR